MTLRVAGPGAGTDGGPGPIQVACSRAALENQQGAGLGGDTADDVKGACLTSQAASQGRMLSVCSTVQADAEIELVRDLREAIPDQTGFLDHVISEIPSNLRIQ